jgi:hypothetical protein
MVHGTNCQIRGKKTNGSNSFWITPEFGSMFSRRNPTPESKSVKKECTSMCTVYGTHQSEEGDRAKNVEGR